MKRSTTARLRSLSSWRRTTLVHAIGSATDDKNVDSALEAFEPLLFNTMTLVLDRSFVHRLWMAVARDGNALNEVELLADSR